MELNNIYERLRTEIDKESMSEANKIIFKSIVIQCFMEELSEQVNSQAKEVNDFGFKLTHAIHDLAEVE